MGKRRFDEVELREFVYSDEVWSEKHDMRRWTVGVTTVFKARDDEKLYRVNWEQGLTENQEDEFWELEVEEVFPVSVSRAATSVEYMNEEQLARREALNIAKDAVLASSLISPSAEAGIAAIREYDFGSVLEFLGTAKSAVLEKKAAAFFATSVELFEALQKLQEELVSD